MKQEERQLADVDIGETANVAGIEWIVLDKDEDSALCLTRGCIGREEFDDGTTDYEKSAIRAFLKNFVDGIIEVIGEDSVFKTVIDLMADDGSDDYGYVVDKVGLLTCDAYRKYKRVIEKYRVNHNWWLATAHTANMTIHKRVMIVTPSGVIEYDGPADHNYVRPLCIFKSSLFVS